MHYRTLSLILILLTISLIWTSQLLVAQPSLSPKERLNNDLIKAAHDGQTEKVLDLIKAGADMNAKGICFYRTKNINLPMNLVNPWNNRSSNLYSVEELLAKFQLGLKIDILQFHKVKNRAPHVDYNPTFISRK